MNLDAFLADREPEWDNLETALKRARGRPERLGAAGALDLGRGYRAAVADLALARRRYPGDPVVDRLERLVLAARQAVYGRRPRAGTLIGFATRRYWQLVAERPGMLALAAAATFLPCVLAGLWALHDPGAALGLVPGKFQAAAHVHVHKLPFGATTQATLASSIFTNNIQVTFLAFAGGLLLGAGSSGGTRLQRCNSRRAGRSDDWARATSRCSCATSSRTGSSSCPASWWRAPPGCDWDGR